MTISTIGCGAQALCLLEEVDLSANFAAYQLVKNYIDNPHITIRGIYAKAETERNYTHIIQTANYRHFCPIYPGDARINMWRVDPFDGPDLDWTGKLCPLVDQQMPAFLHYLLKLEMPPSAGWLYLPILDTKIRREAMADAGPKCRAGTDNSASLPRAVGSTRRRPPRFWRCS